MFDDKIVCLGAGIESDENLPVTTSVNQSYLNGDVEFKTEGGNYRWILHDNIGYYFPNPSKMTLKTSEVQGRWTDVTKLLSDELLSADIFKLYFEHGKSPEDESYSYILVPNAKKSVLEEMETELSFKIKNETDRQEVVANGGSVAGVIFYEPGKSDVFGGIETDNPCLVMLKKQKNGMQLSIADPTQELKELGLLLESEYSGENAVAMNGKTKINIELPQNEEAGKTVTLQLKKQ
jgi:chondroitin AC lyase